MCECPRLPGKHTSMFISARRVNDRIETMQRLSVCVCVCLSVFQHGGFMFKNVATPCSSWRIPCARSCARPSGDRARNRAQDATPDEAGPRSAIATCVRPRARQTQTKCKYAGMRTMRVHVACPRCSPLVGEVDLIACVRHKTHAGNFVVRTPCMMA